MYTVQLVVHRYIMDIALVTHWEYKQGKKSSEICTAPIGYFISALNISYICALKMGLNHYEEHLYGSKMME